jgi:chemotaxis response regulator CheB
LVIYTSNFDVVGIGASAGGIEALLELLPRFPKNFPATILVDQHVRADHKNILAELLAKKCEMSVRSPENEETLRPSAIYICPPASHLLVSSGKC